MQPDVPLVLIRKSVTTALVNVNPEIERSLNKSFNNAIYSRE